MKLLKILLILSVLSASFSVFADENKEVNIKKVDQKILWEDAKLQSDIWKRSYKRKRAAGISLIAIGAATTSVGLGLLGVYFAYTGTVGYAPIPIIVGGLSIVSGGVGLSYSADYSLAKSELYLEMSSGGSPGEEISMGFSF